MKATDLMVGDIIYRPDCYDKVVEIRLNGIIGQDFNRGLISFDEIRPIEITKEILEKIGLNKCDDMEWCRVTHEVWEFGDNFYLYYDPYYNSFYIGTYIGDKNGSDIITDSIKIEYLHELQHIFSIYKINKIIIL